MASTQSLASVAGRDPREWTTDEHARYLAAKKLYPTAKWKVIAKLVGTRTARQTMTHAQKIAQKERRHARGLRVAGRPPVAKPKQTRRKTKQNRVPVEAVEEESESDAPASLLDSATACFLDTFQLDALVELGSSNEDEIVWMDMALESPTSPGRSRHTFG